MIVMSPNTFPSATICPVTPPLTVMPPKRIRALLTVTATPEFVWIAPISPWTAMTPVIPPLSSTSLVRLPPIGLPPTMIRPVKPPETWMDVTPLVWIVPMLPWTEMTPVIPPLIATLLIRLPPTLIWPVKPPLAWIDVTPPRELVRIVPMLPWTEMTPVIPPLIATSLIRLPPTMIWPVKRPAWIDVTPVAEFVRLCRCCPGPRSRQSFRR